MVLMIAVGVVVNMMNIGIVNIIKLHSAKRIDLKSTSVYWEIVVDTEYNGEVETNKRIVVSGDDFKMIVEKGYYEVIEIWQL